MRAKSPRKAFSAVRSASISRAVRKPIRLLWMRGVPLNAVSNVCSDFSIYCIARVSLNAISRIGNHLSLRIWAGPVH